jgi:hypothetical protein
MPFDYKGTYTNVMNNLAQAQAAVDAAFVTLQTDKLAYDAAQVHLAALLHLKEELERTPEVAATAVL